MKKPIKLSKKSKTVLELDEEEFSWDLEIETTRNESLTQRKPTTKKYSGKFSKALAPKEPKFELTPQQTKESSVKGQRSRGKSRAVQITLEYNTVGLNQSDMLMEVIASRNIVREDWTGEDWSRYLHNVGQVPFYILCGDVDRYHLAIYAAEYLRRNPEFKNTGIGELAHRHPEAIPHRKFAPNETQPEIDGNVWGGLDEVKPVREQIAESKKAQLDKNRSQAAPADINLTREAETDAYLAKWMQAEKTARAPRDTWEGKVDWEFEQMIKYCYGWLRDIGEVPQPYPMGSIDLFWQRPTPSEIRMDEKTVMRRNYITAKVMKFWDKSLNKDGNKDKMHFRHPLSYRVVLAAQELGKAIEDYATSDGANEDADTKLQARVKTRAVKYFNAHFPIEYEGAKAGPMGTLDPDYVSYVRLCRKYNLKEGTMLHEADL